MAGILSNYFRRFVIPNSIESELKIILRIIRIILIIFTFILFSWGINVVVYDIIIMYKTLFSSAPVNYDSNNIDTNPVVEKPLINSKKVSLSIKNLSSFDILKFIIVSTITFILPRLLWEFYYKNFDPQNPPFKKLLTFLSGKSEQVQHENQTQPKLYSSDEIKNGEAKPVFHIKKNSEIIMDKERLRKPSKIDSSKVDSPHSGFGGNQINSNDEIMILSKVDDESINEGTITTKGKEIDVSRNIEENNSINIKTLMSTITNNLIPLQETNTPNSIDYVLSKYRDIINDCEEMINNFIYSDALSKSELYSFLQPLKNSINKTENFFLTKRNITAIVVGRKTQGKSKLINAVFREDCELIDEKIGDNITKQIFKIANGKTLEIYELSPLDNNKVSVMGNNYILEAANQIISYAIIPDLIIYVCKANSVSNIIYDDINTLHDLKECIQSCSLLMINVPIIPVITHVDEVYPADIISPEDYDEEKIENIQEISKIVMKNMKEEIELKTLDIFPVSSKYYYKPNTNQVNPRRDYRYNNDLLLKYIEEQIQYLQPSSLTNHYHFANKLVMTLSVINKKLSNATFNKSSTASLSGSNENNSSLIESKSNATNKAVAKVSKYYKKFNLDKYVIIFYMVIIIALECSQFKQYTKNNQNNQSSGISKNSLYKILLSNINASINASSINKMTNLNNNEKEFIDSFLEFWKIIGFKEIGKMSLFQFSEAMLNKKFPMLGDLCNNSINLVLKIVTGESFDYDDITLKIGFSAIQWFVLGKQQKKELIKLMMTKAS
ncbi:hypothetical protein BCR36DRAFT_342421 [Piromyces finnis]|uniref:G domain-containing protein n=1 Tax=Piromyces finnis TaxID=1754191 RepID=A0A1Y1VMD2_9FUNG|nr:hypothetical protein BCR36DRAFT_342421 [Piromyces finnis]|eukprot:ORX60086.1 hypothetical protein BCR36DRAFT_342421 [Piromyces finnis]